jgi:hypothetical protein
MHYARFSLFIVTKDTRLLSVQSADRLLLTTDSSWSKVEM